jgi:hypothetical protein
MEREKTYKNKKKIGMLEMVESPCAGSRPAFPPSKRVSLPFNSGQYNKNKKKKHIIK